MGVLCFWLMASAIVGAAGDRMGVPDRLRVTRSNCTMAALEREIELGPAIAVVAPTVTDPFWWFRYRHGDVFLWIGANKEDGAAKDGQNDPGDFYYANFFKVTGTNETIDQTRTWHVRWTGCSVTNEVTEHLRTYDMRVPSSIYGIASSLRLGTPKEIAPGGFVFPMWTFVFRTTDGWIKLYGRPLHAVGVGDTVGPRDCLFTGYWDAGLSGPEDGSMNEK